MKNDSILKSPLYKSIKEFFIILIVTMNVSL